MELLQSFENLQKIEVYNEGNKVEFLNTDKEYKSIVYEWNQLCFDAIKMPAYGVSLNDETEREIKQGVWVNFIFNRKQIVDGMFFEALLVKVEKEWQAFNLIRYNAKTGYNGRCFYLQLNNKNMFNLYNLLINL
ncbi:MAG: hypothetical protein E7370_05185 [Clostridiales bacterium]|nr:hypothetical protein [Clostridiales bacterium]